MQLSQLSCHFALLGLIFTLRPRVAVLAHAATLQEESKYAASCTAMVLLDACAVSISLMYLFAADCSMATYTKGTAELLQKLAAADMNKLHTLHVRVTSFYSGFIDKRFAQRARLLGD
jgi:hypothetical protein